ncbi:MAG: hypothetical protein KJ630_09090 [Proteobacteria bacterium]|nr:hypothetical protein [Pseudomonadota bacterium]
MDKRCSSKSIFFIASVVVLTLGFYNNFWGTADSDEFGYFQKDSESLVIGRLALAQKQGIFSQGGFLCRIEPVYPANCTPKQRNELFAQREANQYSVYLSRIDTGIYTNYASQMGFQGMCYAILDKILGFKTTTKIEILYLITSLMSAIAMSLIILWISIQFGIIKSTIVLLLMVFAPSLTLFGRNLYWVVWAFYIPFITSIFLLNSEVKLNISTKRIVVLTFISVAIKCLFTGYEFITTVLIMLTTPYFFYAVFQKWEITFFIRRLLIVSASALAGVLSVMTVHIVQISTNIPDVNGLGYIIGKFIHRTSSPDVVSERFEPGFAYDRISIISKYLNLKALSFPKVVDFFSFNISFAQLILIFLICSVLAFISENISPIIARNRRLHVALVSFLWVSFLAPFSWLIIFKQHSYVCIHQNHIVWYMPSVIVGFALCASVGCNLAIDIYSKLKQQFFH